MNSVLFFDWGVKRTLKDKNVVIGNTFRSGEIVLYGNIGEPIGTASMNYSRPEHAVIKYTNPTVKDNFIIVSKNNSNPFFYNQIYQEDCRIDIYDFDYLSVVFSLSDSINIEQGYEGVTYDIQKRDDFKIVFDTKGKNYNVFILYKRLSGFVEASGAYKDPPTCASPYSYITFYRFSQD